MLAAASAGRATGIEGRAAPEADATRDLYERYAGQIFGYCMHRLGSREEAEDAVQSTFLNAFRGLARGVVPESESAWLFKIAENVCHSRHRSSWRRGRVESPSDLDAFQDVLPAPPRAQDELIPLGEALERLPENQRRAILLREWQGLSYREIADELDLSQSAVETLIFRARRSLVDGLESPARRPRQALRRAGRGLDVGGLVGALKMLLGGGGAAAVKVAAVAVAVTGATVAVGRHHTSKPPLAAKPPVVHVPQRAHAASRASAAARPATAQPAAPKTAVRHRPRAASAPATPLAALQRSVPAPVAPRPKHPAPPKQASPPPAPAPAPAPPATVEVQTPPVSVPDPPPTTTHEDPAATTTAQDATSTQESLPAGHHHHHAVVTTTQSSGTTTNG